jgi:capsular polysaccharide transport system permease protein
VSDDSLRARRPGAESGEAGARPGETPEEAARVAARIARRAAERAERRRTAAQADRPDAGPDAGSDAGGGGVVTGFASARRGLPSWLAPSAAAPPIGLASGAAAARTDPAAVAPAKAPRSDPDADPRSDPDAEPGPEPEAAPDPGPAKPQRPRVVVRPVAEPARMKRRHWGLVAGFVVLVLVPLAVTIFYLWAVAEDQYASTVGFTVRKEEGTSAVDLVGGLSQFTGGGGASDGDILYEFIQSQVIVERISAKIDLNAIYSRSWGRDPVFALWPDARIEDLVWFWKRVVRISYDKGSGLIELRVLAPTPQEARDIATLVVSESQEMINNLNAQAREDTTRYALLDLNEALARLKAARLALTAFRTRTRIVDPEADIQGRMGVLNNLQQQLAQAMIEYDLLTQQANPGDPRLKPAQQKIDVIRSRMAQEREGFTLQGEAEGGDYPALIAEYESLVVDREFAERTYTSALAALDIAQSNANRQSRYLAAYIQPTLASTAEFPRRLTLAGLTGLFLLLGWSILALVYYSLRDRR